MKSVCYSKENNPKPVIKCEVSVKNKIFGKHVSIYYKLARKTSSIWRLF